MSIHKEEYIVIKTEEGYLEDAFETDDYEKPNYRFTQMPEYAYQVYDSRDVPGYMWNHIKDKPIEDVKELCEFLNGKLVLVEIVKTVERFESDFDLSKLRVL